MRLLIILFVSFFIATGACANNKLKKQKELSQLKSRIDKLKKTIAVKENSKSGLTQQLRQSEKQIGRLSQQINKTSKELKNKKKSLQQLKINKFQIELSLKQQNRQLSRQLHAAYTLGQQEQIKLLFSQKSAIALQRNLTYYQYFSQYRNKQIEQGRKNYDRLLANEKLILQATAELEKILAHHKEQQKRLNTDRSKRKKIMLNLDEELMKQGKHLTRLQDDAKNLKQLIDSISEILTEIPSSSRPNKRFSLLKGKLAWPVKGKVKKLFGQPKPPSNLHWQGVIINAQSGNNVRAVSHGRIAFSDWLRGMGNLIIIDHGDGYLSLYGHNESLFKTAGEWVEAGEIIGSIGNSGGSKKPGLYFEIRRNGKPQNPSRWCKMANWFASS